MPYKHRKKIGLSIFLIIVISIFFGSFNSIIILWKSVYTEEGQSINAYNSLELDIFGSLERSIKSIFPPSDTQTPKVFLYIGEKNQKHLLSSLPYSKNNWVKGLILDGGKLKNISVKHRGDNPNNWLHDKKSWRVKRKKSDLDEGIRVFNYSLPRDTSLVNTYMGYFIAKKMNIPVPEFQFVELYVNDVYEGLYLETQHIDENFLRMNNTMPVNIYKGTPSRTDKPINLDNDLFNNPHLWDKRSIFNARDPNDYFDISKLLVLTRSAVNSPKDMSELEQMAEIKKWAKFSAYETLMQSWHNYEKNNMYLISDPWTGQIYPIAYDTIFNDTKSRLVVDEPVYMDNGAHALMEVYLNNSNFLYEKYKIMNELINMEFYSDIKKEVNRVYDLINQSWQDDPSHVQFVLTNEFERKLFFNGNMDKEITKLLERIDFIEENIIKKLANQDQSYWSQYGDTLDFVINSYNPVSKIRLCLDNEIFLDSLLLETEERNFLGLRDGEGCYSFEIIMNSNRVKHQQNRSRITTFFASSGFNISPTLYNFTVTQGVKIKELYAKHLGRDTFVEVENNSIKKRYSKAMHNQPIGEEGDAEVITWQGDIYINELLIVNEPLKILPGTNVYLSPEASIIFKNNVQSIGEEDKKIRFLPSEDKPWGIIALFGENTNGSFFEYTSISGGSGGHIGGYEFTGMFSIYSSQDIKLSKVDISNNSKYDDLIHILYSKGIELTNSNIFDARSDAIDIDISEMNINNCNFYNSGNDAIDSMTSKVSISNTRISKAGDKGLSAGENSEVLVTKLIFDETNIGIQSKDGTQVRVFDSVFKDNVMQLDAYQKNWRYGDGGKIEVSNSTFEGKENRIDAKNKSKIIITDSSFNGGFSDLESKKVIMNNNRRIY